MNSLLLPIATTLLILFLIPLSSADVILDTDGNPVQYGLAYYILPVVRGQGGGLTTKENFVVQEQKDVSLGHPVVFFNQDETEQVISTSSSIKVFFDGTSNVWGMTHCNITYNYYISVGTTAGFFTVEKESLWYKLRHNSINEMPSGYFGAILEDKIRYLFLSNGEHFLVMFRKYEDSTQSEL